MILVTGGAGYIGSVLVKALLSKKYKVRVFDSLIFGKDSLRTLREKIELVKGDIRNPPSDLFKNIKTVIHLAGLSNDPTANFDPQANFAINTLGTYTLASLAKRSKVRRFIFASSCSIYDQGLNKEQKIMDEQSSVNPTAPYSVSKFLAEQRILPLADNKFEVVILRKGTVFGYSPRMRYDLVINTMVKDAFLKKEIRVFCSGLQWRPLIPIEDVVRIYLLLIRAEKNKINRQIFNALNYNLKIIDVAKEVRKAMSSLIQVKIIADKKIIETRSYRVSNEKIKRVLGYKKYKKITMAVSNLVWQIKNNKKDDFDNPRYYNIDWLKLTYQKGKYL